MTPKEQQRRIQGLFGIEFSRASSGQLPPPELFIDYYNIPVDGATQHLLYLATATEYSI
jgi:hypothetical protein